MKIHEYQAKELFRAYGVPCPAGRVVFAPDKAGRAAAELGGFPVVVKAQIHAGGRGKGGGVKLAHSVQKAEDLARQMLGMTLVTPQTGPEGKVVGKVLVEAGCDIENELYLAILQDRASADMVIMASQDGGMDIEKVADQTPDRIIKVHVDPLIGIQPHHCRAVAFGLELSGEALKSCLALVYSLYKLAVEKDCSMVEINPLVVTSDNQLLALDGKINFDDSALYRNQDIKELHDADEDEPLEAEAMAHNLNYIKLDGNVGNMVNGAGLAMATMDIIKMAGAEPANFLDVGGGASAEMVENGFRIILKDPNVKAILVNIFGGILRCDVLASGIVQAATKTSIEVPVVVRMEGTNVEQGRTILADSGLNLITAVDLKDAAAKIADLIADNQQDGGKIS